MKKIFLLLAFSLLIFNCEAQSTDKSEFIIDTLIINKNDKRFFVAEHDLNNNLRFKEVLNISDSTKTLSVQLTVNDAMGSILKISNPFSDQLVYKAEMYSYKKKDFIETSTIPVYPKLVSFETWPYKIDILRLTTFKIIKR